MRYFIFTHLGLGDHIICNGLYRKIINKDDEYFIFVKEFNMKSVAFMLKDLENVKLISLPNTTLNDFYDVKIPDNSHKIKIGFTKLPYYFDQGFYQQHNIPFEHRWSSFFCERNYESEYELFKKFNVKEGQYVFLHDDPSRGYIIDRKHILNKDLPVITPKVGLTDNVFDYCYLMQHSYESHFIDSSIRLLFDSYKLRDTNLYYHINLLGNFQRCYVHISSSILNYNMI